MDLTALSQPIKPTASDKKSNFHMSSRLKYTRQGLSHVRKDSLLGFIGTDPDEKSLDIHQGGLQQTLPDSIASFSTSVDVQCKETLGEVSPSEEDSSPDTKR